MLHTERSFGERFADEDNAAAPLHFDDVLAASSRDRSLPKKEGVVANRRGQPSEPAASIECEGMLRILVAMTTEALRERFVDQDPVLSRSFPTAEALARALSEIWHRTMREYEKVRAPRRG